MTCTLLMAVMVAPLLQTHPAVVSAQSALKQLSAARPEVRWDAKSGVWADFDCDGRPDRAFLGRNAGRVYVGLVRAAGQKPEILDFAVSAAVQDAICAEPAKLVIESLDYDPTEAVGTIDGFRRSATCKGLRLSGGDCDSVHLFWNHVSKSLDWWRL